MSRLTNKLSATAVRNAKPKDKTVKLADGGGLYLEITPTGSKYWRMKYPMRQRSCHLNGLRGDQHALPRRA
ncbi:Arm DNA-binding domain-containing protein [Billgrantia gudaonensis]|uniref:Integrase DNA-binding domain-containing protein n=1 Tax=Billgrantia gudaonensis TaxID=376427 RepID=A0A1G9CTJ4_9GAMM|nr:Arm DNA-binding domain-containing protein [Halomonas gudaonensis]SDK54958.1 protein of unknown function [Halomonas gudaonensis]